MTTQINVMHTQITNTFSQIDKLLSQIDIMFASDLRTTKPTSHPNTLHPSCCTMCKSDANIKWTQCGHRYCVKCMAHVISEHISLTNEIPKCVYIGCNQSLNIHTLHQQYTLQWSYPSKYKIKISFAEYNHMHKLIKGYLRMRKITVPTGITLLIFDYYYFNYVKPIKCDKCKSHISHISPHPPFIHHMSLSQALKLNVYDKIDHRDHFGRFTPATIIDKIGSNLKIHYDQCDTWSDFHLELYRFASYKSISTRPAHRLSSLTTGSYIDINPIRKHYGWKYAEIRGMDDKSGQIQASYQHNNKHYLYWMHLDNTLEIAPFTSMCGTQSFAQRKCECECVLTLDFNKLCQKQSLCMKCNEYYPNNCIIYWSKCNHILCIHCLISVTKTQLLQHKIPICPVVNCPHEIASNERGMEKNNIRFLCKSWQKSNKYLEDELKLLLYRKNRFECSYCSKWHRNSNLFVGKSKLSHCEHKYSNVCHNILVYKSEVGHTDCWKCSSQCEICGKCDENRYLIAWTKCGHKYHKKCARKYVNEWIERKASIASIFGNDDMIPLCIGRECNALLHVLCAQIIGVTHHQCKVLYELRQQSILIEENNDNYNIPNYLFNTCNKEILMNLDFASVEPIKLE